MSGGAPAMPSGALRRWVWVSRAVVSPAERAVLLALADYADEHGRGARPSIETLCARLGMWPSAVRRRLDALVRSGHLSRRVVSRRAPTVYDLLLDCPVWPERAPEVPSERAPQVESPEVESPEVESPEVRERAPEVVSQRAPEVPRSSPRTSPEPAHTPRLSHAGAREDAELPPEQWGKGWGTGESEEQEKPEKPEKLVPQSLNGPSQHAFYGSRGEEGHRPSTSASAISESASPVVSDIERAVAHYAEVAPLTLRRSLRGPSRARADVEAAVVQHGADAVCAAIDDARRARADGCPPWDWVVQRLEGRAPKVNGISRPRVSGDPRKSEGWSWKP